MKINLKEVTCSKIMLEIVHENFFMLGFHCVNDNQDGVEHA